MNAQWGALVQMKTITAKTTGKRIMRAMQAGDPTVNELLAAFLRQRERRLEYLERSPVEVDCEGFDFVDVECRLVAEQPSDLSGIDAGGVLNVTIS
jgi:hypothetical protein